MKYISFLQIFPLKISFMGAEREEALNFQDTMTNQLWKNMPQKEGQLRTRHRELQDKYISKINAEGKNTVRVQRKKKKNIYILFADSSLHFQQTDCAYICATCLVVERAFVSP